MTQEIDIDAELATLAETIAAARRNMAGGDSVDVTGLPERTELICRAIGKLPQESGREYEARILSVIEALDDLADKIGNKNNSLNELLAELGDTGVETSENG